MSKKFITTAIGTAIFPHLEKPDFFKGQEKFKVNVGLNKADGEAFKAKLLELIKDEKFETKKPKVPYKEPEEGEGLNVNFSSKFKPALFDSKNRRIPDGVRVGGGSKIRVMGELYNYGEGISLRLKQVQVLSLAERGDGAESAFDEVDDGYTTEIDVSAFGEETEAVSALDL